jgi:hypothetical protein
MAIRAEVRPTAARKSLRDNIGSLTELDLEDLTLPLNEVRQYQAAQQEKVGRSQSPALSQASSRRPAED